MSVSTGVDILAVYLSRTPTLFKKVSWKGGAKCKYVMSINHFLKKFNKTEEGEHITIPDEDGDDDSLMTDLALIPTAAVPQQIVDEDPGRVPRSRRWWE